MKLKTEETAANENEFDGQPEEEETAGKFISIDTNREQCISKLALIKEQYQSQLAGIDKRFYGVKTRVLSCSLIEAVLLVWMFFLISVGTRFPQGLSMFAYVAVALTMVLIYKNNEHLINAIVSCGIHYEKKGFLKMKIEFDVFTLVDERKHCEKELSNVNHMLEELRESDKKWVDRKYWDCEYIQKYASAEINNFYQKYYAIILLVSVILFFVVLVIVGKLVIFRLNGLF
ncbi:MAG: hypothetical protein NC225_00305 [Clostridium sp.]|nr:hypothetical protein [Clostridium sp.]MCM1397902.1 hypothetical protein [Clostridium sp.]MCM1459140.1 hypothetical protein [Bacteroides sp.]